MKQTDLIRAISKATGEPRGRIARMGFTLLVVPALRCSRPRPRSQSRR